MTIDDHVEILVAGWLTDTNSSEEHAELEQLLLTEARVRDYFAQQCRADVALHEIARRASATDPELVDLVAAWSAGSTDEDVVAALEKRLMADPEARRYFAAQCRQDLVLRDVITMQHMGTAEENKTHTSVAEASTSMPSGKPARSARRKPLRRHGPRRHARPLTRLGAPLAVLAALFVIGLMALVLINQSKPQPPQVPEVVEHTPPPAPTPTPERPTALATIVSTDGEPIANQPGGAMQRVSVGSTLAPGMELDASASTVELALSDGSRVTITDGTVSIRNTSNGLVIDQRSGELQARVARQSRDQQFQVATPWSTLRVIGTVFTVVLDPTQTTLAVDEGRVAFQGSVGSEIVVSGGQNAWAPHNGSAALGTAPEETPQPAITVGRVVDFSLIDAERDVVIPGFEHLTGTVQIVFADLPTRSLNLRANTTGVVGGTYWSMTDARGVSQIATPFEAIPPWSINDNDGDYAIWEPVPGRYVITVTPHQRPDPKSPAGDSAQLILIFTE